MITKILVANRGEIARRVFHTARRLGIGCVAVHSDADAGMPFVSDADEAVRLPGNTPAETYLRGDLVIAAAHQVGADAIHPGYGFLSENADFARAVLDAGLTWIGPAPESIESMGSKIESKRVMAKAGVPVLEAPENPVAADLPLLVKASAGGGGRGMRIVRTLDVLADEIERGAAEAASAFGDGTVFVEPYVEDGRHVEVQVLGTSAGALVFGERDCSIQRRHQKVIEEAPAPLLPEATRSALHAAAKAAAEAIDYRGAGTVEFLYDPGRDRFYFLEMNTRLQVEHPVTEAVHGVDLVELQIAVAEGRPVAAPRQPDGHAIEVRLYAEDPAHDYQPQNGRITRFDFPDETAAFAGPAAFGLRLDSGVGEGDEIGSFYDAMIAKVIVHAPTREQALRQLRGALRRARIHGLRTNRDLLVELLADPVVVAGTMTTTYLDRAELTSLRSDACSARAEPLALFAAAVAWTEDVASRRGVQMRIPSGWRNVAAAPRTTTFEVAGAELEIAWVDDRGRYRKVRNHDDDVDDVVAGDVSRTDTGWRVTTLHEGVSRTFDVSIDGHQVDVDGPNGHLALRKVPRFVDPASQVAQGSLLAPMPGTVISLHAAVGDPVAAGQKLLVIEAMKMQHSVVAPAAGTLTHVNVQQGNQVAAGEVLAVVEEIES